jgi:dihydroorotase
VKALHAFAKTYQNSFTLLAASKSNIDSYYKPSPEEFSVSYPDLNDNIFVQKPIYPIRNRNVVEYMQKRYPQLDLAGMKKIFVDLATKKGLNGTETEVENLVVHWTGGVGRMIHAIMNTNHHLIADLSPRIVCDPILYNSFRRLRLINYQFRFQLFVYHCKPYC